MSAVRDIVVMVDATYFRKTVHEVLGHGVDPDYSGILSWVGRANIAEARCYDAMPYQDPREPASEITLRRAAEFADIAKSGFTLRQGVCTLRGGLYEQHEIDTLMVADLVTFAFRGTKKFIVIAGNQDIAPGIDVAVDKGAMVDVLVDRHHRGTRLIDAATTVHRLQVRELELFVKPALMEVAA